ncbi:MAG TPA: hypothetical protein VF525_14875 [Pyrinomonadaceae bacterium]
MNKKCPNCGLINWETDAECKRCHMPFGANAPVPAATPAPAAYVPGQWSSPYAPPPPTAFYPTNAYPGAIMAEAGVWRQESTIIAALNPAREATLPAACVKCGGAVEAADFKKKFYWHNPAYYLLLLVNLLVFAIVAMIVRKRATVYMGVCPEHRAKRRRAITLSWALAGIGILLFFVGAINEMPALMGLGGLNIIGAVIYAVVTAHFIIVKKIDERFIWLKGFDAGYLNQLPDWPGQ